MNKSTPEELRADREALGLTSAELASELLVDERNIVAWEAGKIRPPARLAKEIAWRAALARRDAALEQSGLPTCDWVLARDKEIAANPKKVEQYSAALDAHVPACPVCMARETFVKDNLPPLPPPPLPAPLIVLGNFIARVNRLPLWARPAVYGGAIISAMTLVRALIALLIEGFSWKLLVGVAGAIAIGFYAGAVGGIAYYFARPRVQRFAAYAPYLLGVTCIATYLLAFGVPILILTKPPLRELMSWVLLALPLTMLFGVALGRGLLYSPPTAERAPADRRAFRFAVAAVVLSFVIAIGAGLALQARSGWVDDWRDARSIEEMRKLVRAAPTDPGLQLRLGFMLADSGRYTEAIGPLRETARLSPRNDTAYDGLASAYYNLKDYAASAENARRAVELAPEFAGYHLSLGHAVLGLGKYPDALKHFRTSVQLDSTNAWALSNLARLAHMMELYQESADAYERLARLHPAEIARSEDDRRMWAEAKLRAGSKR